LKFIKKVVGKSYEYNFVALKKVIDFFLPKIENFPKKKSYGFFFTKNK